MNPIVSKSVNEYIGEEGTMIVELLTIFNIPIFKNTYTRKECIRSIECGFKNPTSESEVTPT
jgi:hypothetical protein